MHFNKFKTRALILTVAAVLAMTMLAPLASYASPEGNRNTAIGLAGVAAYLLMNGKTAPGLAAAVGSGYAYSRYSNERDNQRYWNRYDNSRNWDWNRDRDRRDNHSRYNDRDRYDRDHSRYSSRDNNNQWNRSNNRWDKDYSRR